MKSNRFEKTLGIWFLLALFALIANALISIQSVRTLNEIAASAIRTREVLSLLSQVQNAVTDAETGQRGYLLSEKKSYLSDFENGRSNAPILLAELERLSADVDELKSRMGPLRTAILSKLDELTETIRLAIAGNRLAAVELVKTDAGRNEMERIRGLIASMEGVEDIQLKSREAQARLARSRTAATIGIASIAAALLVLMAFGLVRRDIRRRDKVQRETRDRENRYRFLADSMPQVVWTATPDGKLDYFNQPWFDYSGLDYERSRGEGWAEPIHPDDLPETHRIWSASLSTGAPYQREFRIRRAADQIYRWHLARAIPYRDDSGAIAQWVGTVTDIDDQKRDAERLRDMNEELERRVDERTTELSSKNGELERSNRELQEFASVASHDLQEPLRKIQAFGDRLRTRNFEALGDQGRDYLDRMQASAARMSTLINDLLTFSRVTTKAQPFAMVDLDAISREVLSDLGARISQTGGSVDIGPLPRLEADPLQMRQLLQNLIGNALKFRKLDEAPRVRVRSEMVVPSPLNGDSPGSKAILLSFEDNGIGFDEKYLDRIFNVFQRLHGRSEYEGTGMGLAICRKIVERHGGRITARSSDGNGATFLIMLPVSHDSSEEGRP